MDTASTPPAGPASGADPADPARAPVRQLRPLSEIPALAQAAIDLLRTPTALAELSPDDARCVASYMGVVGYRAGSVVMREGDSDHTGFMLLLLSGEVSIEMEGANPGDSTVISVLGAGHLIGEMGVLDGGPRSTHCVAASRVEAAALTRAALHQLIEAHPIVGARLMAAVAQRLSERLRAAGEQLRMYARLVASQQLEIDRKPR